MYVVFFTLFVACHNNSRSISGNYNVCQQVVQELRHVSHFLLEDGAVHYKHDGSEDTGMNMSLYVPPKHTS